jgi:hypothetical protein
MTEFKDPLADMPTPTIGEIGDNASYEAKARRGIIFEENDLYGLKDSDGTVTFPAENTFIGKCSEYVFLLKPNGEYVKISPGCTESGYLMEKDRPYIKDGKVGFKAEGVVIIPPIYDFIMKKFGDTVFYAVKNGREMYLDDTGREVLTRVRRFKGEPRQCSPFWLCTNIFDGVTMMSYIGHPIADNPNVIRIDNNWVELERYSKEEVMQMLINPSDDLALTSESLKTLCNDFSYEYSFYMATGNGYNGLSDCLQQFKDMGVFCNSWYYVIKIWQAKDEYIQADQLRMFESQLTKMCMKRGLLGKPLFAVGHDDKLAAGKVSVLLITLYNERCWPADFEFEWSDKCKELSLPALMGEVPDLKETIRNRVFDKYKGEVFNDQIRNCIENLMYHKGIAWDDTEAALNYFADLGSSTNRCLHKFAGRLSKCASAGTEANVDELLFFINASIWALNRNVEPNYCWNRKSVLDNVNSIYRNHFPTTVANKIDELRNMLLARGAKTYNQLITERKNNKDYYKELEFIKKANELNIRD